MAKPTPRARIAQQLRDLGVEAGAVLLVHTSFRAVGPVEGGPCGLIDALTDTLGPEGTLVMPSWLDGDSPFDPMNSETSRSLGAVAAAFWRLQDVRRSDHPNAFAARGPAAERILRDPLPLPPHIPESPVGRVHELDGQVLFLGVNHDADTTIHLAEILGGAPYRITKHCTILREGVPIRIEYGENDHCCERFRFVDDWLRVAGLQAEGVVGRAAARLTRSRAIVKSVLPHLREDRFVFLHPVEAGCAECNEAWSSLDTARTRGNEA